MKPTSTMLTGNFVKEKCKQIKQDDIQTKYNLAMVMCKQFCLLAILCGSNLHALAQSGCPVPSFAPPVIYDNGAGTPGSVVVGDFNGDGKVDLAVGNAAGTIGILLGNGNGTFGPTT